uniref:LisH domain-containing protein n=1 Tax=Fusarium oxysporum (strain Fo5176) TaxID=660025 RepID=A0A0D2XR61_FUSOF
MANMKAKTGHLHDASRHLQENYNKRTQLNTYIYEYFLHNSMFQCAQSILKADSDVKVQRHSPGSDRNDKGLRLKNAPCNKTIDNSFDSTHSNLLPAPNVPTLSPDSCFLYEWFCLFWAMFNAQKNENQQNWPKRNVSWPQTQSSLLLLQAPGIATHNAFYNSGEMGEGKTYDNWSVQWQNESNENQIPETSQHGVQGTLQERSRLPPVQPADSNDSAKPRSTISSLSQTSKPALPTPQLSKATREKIPFPKGTIPKKRTTNVKDEVMGLVHETELLLHC